MSRQFNVQGGSASDSVAEAGGGGVAGIFQHGVKALQPGARDRDVYVRILPAFDPHLALHDQSYRQSVGEYRLRDGQIDSDTKSEAFTPWYLQVIAYTYLGNTKEGILSPLTLKGMGGVSLEECACPIHDLYQKARNSDRPDWKALAFAEKEADRRDIALPFQPVHVLFNALWTVGNKGWEQGVFMLKTTGLKHLKTQLCWPARADSAPLDRNWPHYLLGDVTNPETGLTARVYKSQVGTVETYCAHMTMEDFKSTGCQVMPVGPQQLQNRRILGSDETLKLLTYQEIVDWVLYDGFLPRDLVREACGARANIPASDPPTYATASLPPQQHALPQHSAASPHAPQGYGAPQGAPPMGLPQQGYGAPQGAPPMGLPQQAPVPQQAPAPQQSYAPLPTGAPAALPSWATATAAAAPAAPAPSPGPLPAEAKQSIDPGKRYAVFHEGKQQEGTWQEVVQWFTTAQPPMVGVQVRPTDLTQDWQPIENLLGGGTTSPQAAPLSAAPAHSSMGAPSQALTTAQSYNGLPASPAAPALPQAHSDGDYIPGVDQPQNGPLPGVAFVADAQPVPLGAPSSGSAAGPLSPEEMARFEYLRSIGPAAMQPREVGELALLSARMGG
jgi:hypothetical protein